MMIARVMRAAAVAIAIAALIDPPLTMTARGRPRVALYVTDADGSFSAIGRAAAGRLVRDLYNDFDVVSGRDDEAAAAVVIGSRYPDAAPPETQRVFTVTTAPSPTEPDVRVIAVRVPREVPHGTLIHIEIDVDAFNAAGSASTSIVRAGQAGVEVARATHAWTDAAERWRMSADVTPLGPPPWRLHVDVSGVPGEHASFDNMADAMVAAAEPLRVLVYQPRPSWAGTFVLRALESDSRFEVASLSYPSRGVQVTAGGAQPLQSISLDRVRAIVVGGLDRLTAGDGRVLERFMREREGSVVLLPDSRNDVRTAAQWLSIPAAKEVLLEKAARLTTEAPLPSFAASEMLTFSTTAGMHVLARTSGSNDPVLAVLPYGAGRLLVSGALDAWRFRADDNGAFDRFWQASVAGAAMAASPAIDVQVVTPVVTPAERVDVRVRVRRTAFGLTPTDALHVSSTLNTGDPVRLWPDAAPDTFRGSFVAPRTSSAGHLEVAVDGAAHATASTAFVVAQGARTARPLGLPLSLLADSRGGIDVTPDRLSELEQRLRREITSLPTRVERRPMRSTWWMLPFAACLSAEWWLRRRRGLR
jgi:hypothetical protein